MLQKSNDSSFRECVITKLFAMLTDVGAECILFLEHKSSVGSDEIECVCATSNKIAIRQKNQAIRNTAAEKQGAAMKKYRL